MADPDAGPCLDVKSDLLGRREHFQECGLGNMPSGVAGPWRSLGRRPQPDPYWTSTKPTRYRTRATSGMERRRASASGSAWKPHALDVEATQRVQLLNFGMLFSGGVRYGKLRTDLFAAELTDALPVLGVAAAYEGVGPTASLGVRRPLGATRFCADRVRPRLLVVRDDMGPHFRGTGRACAARVLRIPGHHPDSLGGSRAAPMQGIIECGDRAASAPF
jgi:hypothetical protein